MCLFMFLFISYLTIFSLQLDMHTKLLKVAAQSLGKDYNFLHGIEACSEILDGSGPRIDDTLKHECLCMRAALFLKVCHHFLVK